MTNRYQLAIATDSPDDLDFILLLESIAQQAGLSTFLVTPANLSETKTKLQNNELEFCFLYDRASDTSSEFIALQRMLISKETPILDALEAIKIAADKTNMHYEFVNHNIPTPFTIIIPSFKDLEQIFLSIVDLSNLGRPFIIKPSKTTGGGIGVVDGAETLEDVLRERQMFQDEQYLLQQKIVPLEKSGKLFWFRVFYVCGHIEYCWWNIRTHVYDILTPEEIDYFQIDSLDKIIHDIHHVCGLNFFSSEIAMNINRDFVVIDYVNEICDMRSQSSYYDGVPDEIRNRIAQHIVRYIREKVIHENTFETSYE